MSAFDDEFGLFGDETDDDEERRSTLGARAIAGGETIIDDVEPEDERPARRRERSVPTSARSNGADTSTRRRSAARPADRAPLAPEVAYPRAVELLTFLAKKLVTNPDAVVVELHPDARGAVLELEVAPEDIGKVIGRGGRIAQALRTLVRAGAEGRVTIDIVDADEGAELSDVADETPLEGDESDAGQGETSVPS